MSAASAGGSRADVVGRLAAAPDRLEAAARLAAVAVGPSGDSDGEWGPIEIVRHLIACETAIWQARLRTLEVAAPGEEPAWAWVEPKFDDGRADRTLDEVLATFARRRFETIALLASLDDRGWARTGLHPTYGRLDVAGLGRVAADHDDEHMATLERLAR